MTVQKQKKQAPTVEITAAKTIRVAGQTVREGEKTHIPADLLGWARQQGIVKEG